MHALSGKRSSSRTQGAASLPVKITQALTLHLLAKWKGEREGEKEKKQNYPPFGAERLCGRASYVVKKAQEKNRGGCTEISSLHWLVLAKIYGPPRNPGWGEGWRGKGGISSSVIRLPYDPSKMSVTQIVGCKGVEQKTFRMGSGDQRAWGWGYPKLSPFRVRRVPLGGTTGKQRSRKADNPTRLIEAQKAEFQPKGDKTLKINPPNTGHSGLGMIKEGHIRSKGCRNLPCRRCGQCGRAHVWSQTLW